MTMSDVQHRVRRRVRKPNAKIEALARSANKSVEAFLIDLYAELRTQRNMANRCGVSQATIWKELDRQNLTRALSKKPGST